MVHFYEHGALYEREANKIKNYNAQGNNVFLEHYNFCLIQYNKYI